ncbi:ubiquitin-like protein Pup [Corynebacterium choanae]|uniref:Prokaryotic ubiquitin-like protein Pup n=1 Tax=Corynebacterium choanae TaxID=1862358 RepID=A0A3G6J679_9CORY|nr:ubiquitin-like protein Pup [Corynebacterium choanae]AZA13567.1 Prokaryotic ubiquitin-like protein Pup [Corynebacterium choanae]
MERIHRQTEPIRSRTVDETVAAEPLANDSLLDEIDALLDENAQEFVHNYVQKGGQ